MMRQNIFVKYAYRFLSYAFTGALSIHAYGQVWNINVLTDSISITSAYNDNRPIVFQNRRDRYSTPVLKYGLHFRNNAINSFTNQVSASGIQGSMILGAHGPATVVKVQGNIDNALGQAFPSLAVTNGGKIYFDSSARVNLILPGSFFTRQFWILGDGTGTIEFDPNFVADRTAYGTVAQGLGSIRLSNAKLITHHEQSLPLGYRPNPAQINAHLVFENEAGSEWHVMTHAQEYKGGVWVRRNLTLFTHTPLTLSGVRSQWPDYINYGGIHFEEKDSLLLTKRGASSLILAGEHAYRPRSTIVCAQGTLEFKTDAFNEADSAFYAAYNRIHGRNLIVKVADSAQLRQTTQRLRLRHLYVGAGTLHTQLPYTLTADSIVLNNTYLSIIIPDGLTLTAGDSFQIFKPLSYYQCNTLPNLPTYNDQIVWDYSSFQQRGVIRVAAGSVVTTNEPLKESFHDNTISFLHPNPSAGSLSVSKEGNLHLIDGNGKLCMKASLYKGCNLSLPKHLPNGLYTAILITPKGKKLLQKVALNR